MGPAPTTRLAPAQAHLGPRTRSAGRLASDNQVAIRAADSPAASAMRGKRSSVGRSSQSARMDRARSFQRVRISLMPLMISPDDGVRARLYDEKMFAIMTVTGQDHTGIIAAVSTALAELDVNIHNVSQTIMDKWFTMILHVGFDDSALTIADIQERMTSVEKEQGLVIRIQSEALFSAVNDI